MFGFFLARQTKRNWLILSKQCDSMGQRGQLPSLSERHLPVGVLTWLFLSNLLTGVLITLPAHSGDTEQGIRGPQSRAGIFFLFLSG